MVIKRISNKIYIIVCLVLSILIMSNMRGVYSDYILFQDYFKIVLLVISVIGIFNLLSIKKTKLNYFLFILLILMVIIVSTTIYLNIYELKSSLQYTIRSVTNSILWIIFLIFSYLAVKNDEKNIKYLRIFTALLPLLLISFIAIIQFSNNQGIAEISSVYYLLFILPILFLEKSKFIRGIGLSIIIVGICMSLKRTGLIALMVFLLLYLIINAKIKEKSNKDLIKNILKLAFSSGIILMIGYYIITNYNIRIVEKLINSVEDGGSGRDVVWSETIDMIKKSDIIELAVGHGYDAVSKFSSSNLSAHNDFLEVVYDYGIVGFMIYCGIWYILLKKGILLYNNKSKYAPSFLASLGMAFVFSLTSHLVIYPTYFLILCLFWGGILGINDKIGNEEKNGQS